MHRVTKAKRKSELTWFFLLGVRIQGYLLSCISFAALKISSGGGGGS